MTAAEHFDINWWKKEFLRRRINPTWAELFWKSQGCGEGLVGPRWKKNMLYLRKFLSILHEILYIYCTDNMK